MPFPRWRSKSNHVFFRALPVLYSAQHSRFEGESFIMLLISCFGHVIKQKLLSTRLFVSNKADAVTHVAVLYDKEKGESPLASVYFSNPHAEKGRN